MILASSAVCNTCIFRRTWIFQVIAAMAGLICFSGFAQAPKDKSGVKPNSISLPSGAGSIEGLGESFEPQLNTGSSTYGIEITVPPGRGGLIPSVGIRYNSFGGNGLCGIGWSLEFPSIKRQTDKGFPSYSDNDTFIYDGEELVPLSNPGGDWRCENERGFKRLRQIDSNSDGLQDSWEVTERNGTRHTFGRWRGQNAKWSSIEKPNSVSPDFDKTYCWMLDSTTDLHGNSIVYEYTAGTGVLYPSRITYNHLGEASREIHFSYEDREDPFDDFRPSFRSRLDKRLNRIEVRSQGTLVRAYNFSYDYVEGDLTESDSAQESTHLDLEVTLLKRVTQVDGSGSDSNFLPPLVFRYSGLDLDRAELRSFATFPELDLADPSGRVQLADLDGDALPDLFATSLAGAGLVQRVALNRGESRVDGVAHVAFASAKQVAGSSPIDLAQPDSVVHDPQGKGLVDLSALSDDGGNKRLETFLNRARLDVVNEDWLGFSQEDFESTPLPNPPAFVSYSAAATRHMDVNFDKRSDFINLESGFGLMKVNTFYLGRSGWTHGESFLPASYPIENTFQTPEGEPNPCVHLADMNGDRMLDLVCLTPEPSPGGQRIGVRFWPLISLGEYGEAQDLPPSTLDTFDIGTVDLRDVLVEDFTGDGLSDIVIIEGSGDSSTLTLRVNVAGRRWSPPFTRSGLPRYEPRAANNPTVLRLADFNANGSLDILFRNTAPGDSWDYLELLPQGVPSILAQIDNGLGKRTKIFYGTAAEDEQIDRESGHP